MINSSNHTTFSLEPYKTLFVRLIGLFLIVGFLTRFVLLFNGQTELPFPLLGWLNVFGLGMVNDLCLGVIAVVFLWLIFMSFSETKYKRPWGYVFLCIWVLSLCYVSFFNNIFDEYGSAAPRIAKYFLLYKSVSFATRLFIPFVREKWRVAQFYFLCFIYTFCILLNVISEYAFWNEFGVRYNFIAVDYLIYTNEVIGNICESYPIVPILLALAAASMAVTLLVVRKLKVSFLPLPSPGRKIAFTAGYVVVLSVACLVLKFNNRFQQTSNAYVNELQANGLYKFYQAFLSNKLDYDQFYTTLPTDQVKDMIHQENYPQSIHDSLPEQHKNVVLITVESLSASFLSHYGNKQNITPHLDALVHQGLVFNNLFATGNRTVRGLEAVTLCLPPSPGESVIKRPNNANLFSTGKVFKDKGYIVQFMYGGDSYFDNMKTFFEGNHYQVIDKKSFAKKEITFSNVWGVCDEDMFNKAIKIFNADAATGKPFFGHIMTVSNHRPFTYPAHKIDIPEDAKSREGGVKYTDYAIGRFLEMAKKEPWFKNTVFVITADHCASSAGKTEIPLGKYHIPAIVYAPGFVKSGKVDKLVSQIDLMPTVMGFLHFSYTSDFYGKNIFSATYQPRAFVATYQNLGYLQNHIFTILSPVRRVEQYKVNSIAVEQTYMTPLRQTDRVSLMRAISNYQSLEKQTNN
ncbi:MAG: sulfatase-like hydrolase/transferase [Dysgonamonadaceae bacterium]